MLRFLSTDTAAMTLPAVVALTCAAMSAPLPAASPAAETPPVVTVQQSAFPANGYHTIVNHVHIAPNGQSPWHTHAGIESTYVAKGTVILTRAGQPRHTFSAGDTFLIEPDVVHRVTNGSQPSELISTYVVQLDKPLMDVTPATAAPVELDAAAMRN